MFTMILQLVILISPLIQWSVSLQTIWDDDNRSERQSKLLLTTTTPLPPKVDPLFDSSPCYFATCDDLTIQAIRSGTEFIDKVRCQQLDTQCHCCLRSQLNRSELDKLYKSIGSSLASRLRSSSSRSPGSGSSSFPSSGQNDNNNNQLCKVLNCDDYQVKAIKSLGDPNSECNFHGDPEENECQCCVKSINKSISSASASSSSSNQRSTINSNNNNNSNSSSTRGFINPNSFDLGSNFFDLFAPPSKSSSSSKISPPSSSYDSSSSNSGSLSTGNLFDVDCLHANCNSLQVKAIKRLPSHVITCIKMGNSDDCKCCYNSSISIFDRVKYEIELTNINRLQQSANNNNNRDTSSYPIQPQPRPQLQSTPLLARRSPSYGPLPPSSSPSSSSPSSSSSSSSTFFEPSLDCSLHHCQSDLVQLIRSIPAHVISCSTLNDYFNLNSNHCKCCIDSTLSNGLNLRNFLRFINL